MTVAHDHRELSIALKFNGDKLSKGNNFENFDGDGSKIPTSEEAEHIFGNRTRSASSLFSNSKSTSSLFQEKFNFSLITYILLFVFLPWPFEKVKLKNDF